MAFFVFFFQASLNALEQVTGEYQQNFQQTFSQIFVVMKSENK